MGYQLRRDLREVLGPDITGLQRAVALEIADDANEETRTSWVGLEDLARWTGAKDAVVVRNALKRLAAAGWEFRIPIGKGKDGRILFAIPGQRMTFAVPPFKGVATATPCSPKGERGLTPEGAVATPYGEKGEPRLPLGVAVAPPSDSTPKPGEDAGRGLFSTAQEAARGVVLATPSVPQGVAPAPPSSKEQTEVEEEASTQGVATAPSLPATRDLTAAEKKEFGNFWLLYPKSKDYDATLAAWTAAVVGGVDPQKITAAAVAYAKEKAGENFQFVKYSVNWLKQRRYEDKYAPEPNGKPDLKAVGGKSHKPFEPPTDHSVYENGFPRARTQASGG